MRRRLLNLNIIYATVIFITYLLLDKEGHYATNIVVMAIVTVLFALGSYFYLNNLWFKHFDVLDDAIKEMREDHRVEIKQISKEREIENIQLGLENLSEHIESIATKYGYRKGQLEAILGSLKTGLVAITQEGKVIFHNPKFSEIYLLGTNIQGKSIYENIYDKNLLEVLEESVHTEIYVRPNVLQTNGLVYNFKGLEIKSKNDRIGTLIVIEDVSKVYQVDKMKTDFVSNVTHELRTPLTSIRGFAETLRSVDPSDIKTRNKFLDIIEDESNRLQLLINDILYLSEVEGTVTKEKDDVDINRVVREVIELTEPHKKENVRLLFEADQHYIVKFEQYKLKQLLINLVSNSVKYTDEGSVIISLDDDLDHVVLKVKDTGIGIPEKDQGRIFERFYRVDKDRSRLTGGTGLGLSIVKHIAERNEAQIHLESEVGVGTTVTVFIKK